MLPTISGEFRVVADPDLRFTPSGVAICDVRLVASSRKKNEQTQEWEDDKVFWVNAVGFRNQAENMAESFVKGDLVVLNGRIQTEEWEDREGNKRSTVKVLVNDMGHSTKWDASKSLKVERSQGQNQGGGGQNRGTSGPAEDPWAVPPKDEEPPF